MQTSLGLRWSVCLAGFLGLAVTAACSRADDPLPALRLTRVASTVDGEMQLVRFWAPERSKTEPTPILVLLHTWSADYRQDRSDWQREAVRHEWIYLQPNFRGINDHPEACGSPLARQDVLDALDWALKEFQVDRSRIYVAGVSGGGHMTLVMAAYHPERFSAASAWCGPTDLTEWYRFHSRDGKPAKYAQMIAACCGGPPGQSAAVNAEYLARSPVHHLQRTGDLHLDIVAGVNDGKTGSVPIHHSLRAYNVVAAAQQQPVVSEAEIDELWVAGHLGKPQPADTAADPTYGRDILLRRTAGTARITIFDGTHEALPAAACEWLASKSRATISTKPGTAIAPMR
jgi:poly(3-hydroxybutyrate) depolymerase